MHWIWHFTWATPQALWRNGQFFFCFFFKISLGVWDLGGGGSAGLQPPPPPLIFWQVRLFLSTLQKPISYQCAQTFWGTKLQKPPPPFNSKYLSMPMKIGVILLFRIFQSASSLRGVGIRYPGGLEKENCEIDNFLLYNCEKDIYLHSNYKHIFYDFFLSRSIWKKKVKKSNASPPCIIDGPL